MFADRLFKCSPLYIAHAFAAQLLPRVKVNTSGIPLPYLMLVLAHFEGQILYFQPWEKSNFTVGRFRIFFFVLIQLKFFVGQ